MIGTRFLKKALAIASSPKVVAAIQLAIAAVTLVQAINEVRTGGRTIGFKPPKK